MGTAACCQKQDIQDDSVLVVEAMSYQHDAKMLLDSQTQAATVSTTDGEAEASPEKDLTEKDLTGHEASSQHGEDAERSMSDLPPLKSNASPQRPSVLERALTHSTLCSSESGHSPASSVPSALGQLFNIERLRRKDELEDGRDGGHIVYHASFADPGSLLGKGGYGQVFQCEKKDTREVFAVKMIQLQGDSEDRGKIEEEIEVFKLLDNPYIVKLHNIYEEDGNLLLVMDFCEGGSLMSYLCSYWINMRNRPGCDVLKQMIVRPGLATDLVQRFTTQMLAGIAYLHHHKIAHRDIKCENYMLKGLDRKNNPAKLQLIDFGLATSFSGKKKLFGCCGTYAYMAPEVLSSQPYDSTCDIWSIGVTTYVICCGSLPWTGSNKEEIMDDIRTDRKMDHSKYWSDPALPNGMKDLVDRLMARDPAVRPSAKALISQTKWMQSLEDRSGGTTSCCCTIL